ncbi:MAG: hypothetical protein NTY15_13795 [Planctomycetota bacterium]|nr:hypothetical protein [Planctomycetota bacterium]
MTKKDDKLGSLKKARAALDIRHKRNSTDSAPHYLTFRHPQNLFEIDYPAHWKIEQEADGAVEFVASNTDAYIGLMLFRTPISIDAAIIEQSGKWEQIATAMFAKVESTNVRSDPTIIYSNFTADRPEPDQAGQRWFVLCSDLILGISSTCPEQLKETYVPLIERMLSSLRVYRDDELLAARILARVQVALKAQMPNGKVEVKGLNIVTDKFELSIGNILSQVKRNPSKFDEIVDHFIQGTIGLSQTEEELGQESWEAVRGRIQPLLKPDKYIQEVNQKTNRHKEGSAFLISAPWLADLRICFALDNKDTFRFINSLDMQRWNVSLEMLMQVSADNLSAYPEPELHVMKPNESLPGIAALIPSVGAASSYLLHPKLFQIAAQHLGREIVAAVPSRDALMLFEYRDEKETLQNAVAHDFATTNHPISDRLFRVTPDGIALL